MTIYFFFKSGEVRSFEGEVAKEISGYLKGILDRPRESDRLTNIKIQDGNKEYYIMLTQVEMIEVVRDKNE